MGSEMELDKWGVTEEHIMTPVSRFVCRWVWRWSWANRELLGSVL
jgi:hypothetical protein